MASENKTQLTVEEKLQLYRDHVDYLCSLTKDHNCRFESKVQTMITDSLNNTLFAMQKAIQLETTGKEY